MKAVMKVATAIGALAPDETQRLAALHNDDAPRSQRCQLLT
jgi:hypothetical protein